MLTLDPIVKIRCNGHGAEERSEWSRKADKPCQMANQRELCSTRPCRQPHETRVRKMSLKRGQMSDCTREMR